MRTSSCGAGRVVDDQLKMPKSWPISAGTVAVLVLAGMVAFAGLMIGFALLELSASNGGLIRFCLYILVSIVLPVKLPARQWKTDRWSGNRAIVIGSLASIAINLVLAPFAVLRFAM